ncbi:MAG: hypothetical protein ISS79_12440 [Phycisphaerae bacterium]|nr:hypothetical protein [Phycisphaerae bacterium]
MVDFSGDGMVDLADLLEMIEYWDTDHAFYDVGPMPWGDGVVDDADLEVLMNYYGQEVDYLAAMVFDVTPPHNPEPADSYTTDVEKALPLGWTPGDESTVHDLYFGTDRAAVEGADIADMSGIYRGPQYGNSYTPPEGAQVGQTYYWRIDEVKGGTAMRKGEIWSFTVGDYLVVDDFESYTDAEASEIWSTWWDGWGIPANGSTVGNWNSPFVELTIIHGGTQSMPFSYDNSTAPISEAVREWEVAQDWTRRGVELLKLWVYGEPGNSVEPFFVTLEDSAGNSATIIYPDPVPTTESWQDWSVPLADFVGVDLKAIKKMSMGVGNRNTPGGSGRLYIDDIELHLPPQP